MAIAPITVDDTAAITKVNAAITKANLVDDKAAQADLTSEAATRAAAISSETGSRVAADNLRATYAEIASFGSRPGEAGDFFTGDLDGAPASLTPRSGKATTIMGREAVMTGAGIVAPRAGFRVEPFHPYRARAVFRRITNTTDPANDGIRIGLRCLKGDYSAIGTVVMEDLVDVVIANGRLEKKFTFPGDAVSLLPGTVYVRPFVQTFGGDGVTHVEVVEIVDMSFAVDFAPNIDIFQEQVASFSEQMTGFGGDLESAQDDIAILQTNQVTGRKTYETWAALAAVTGTEDVGAEVNFSDSGTHTDPVTSLTVANAGVYVWSVSPAGFKRISGDGYTTLRGALDETDERTEALLSSFDTLDNAVKVFTVRNADDTYDLEVGRIDADGTWDLLAIKSETIETEIVNFGNAEISTYETLEPYGAYLIDANDKIINAPDDVAQGEVTDARGSQISLNARLSRHLDSYGNPKAAHQQLELLRQTRVKLRQIKLGETQQYKIAFLGDSWTYSFNWTGALARSLIADYGDAGAGWIDLRPNTGRIPSVYPTRYSASPTGAWTYSPTPSAHSPNISYATSSTAGDTILIVGSALPVLSAARLFYLPASGASIRYRWSGGGGWTTVDLSFGLNLAVSDFVGMPVSGIWSLEIEVVSGTVTLYGVDLKAAANGVRCHKIARDGAMAQHLAAVNPTSWRAGITALAPDCAIVMYGTNDQPARTPGQFAADLGTIITNLRAAVPQIDILIAMPAENLLGRALPMTELAQAARNVAVSRRTAFIDLQPYWGDNADDYDNAGVFPLMAPDDVHPSIPLGGDMIADILYRALTTSL